MFIFQDFVAADLINSDGEYDPGFDRVLPISNNLDDGDDWYFDFSNFEGQGN